MTADKALELAQDALSQVLTHGDTLPDTLTKQVNEAYEATTAAIKASPSVADVGGLLPCAACEDAAKLCDKIWEQDVGTAGAGSSAACAIAIRKSCRHASPPAPANVAGLVAELQELYEKATNGPAQVAFIGDYGAPEGITFATVCIDDKKVAEFYEQIDANFYGALINAFPALVAALSARSPEGVVDAAIALRKKMVELAPKLNSVFVFCHAHGMEWPMEDNWKAEADRLDALLAGLVKGEK